MVLNRRKTAKHGSSKRRRTRKQISNTTTIEMLHTSFTKIDDVVHSMIQKGSSDSAIACRIRSEWKTLFHQTISDTAIEGLLIHYRSIYKGKGDGKGKGKGQKGGMAPLDYVGGQGTTAHTYGNFPVDITTNQKFIHDLDATRNYDSSIGKSCSQTGAGFWDAIGQGHIPASVPTMREVVSAYTPVASSVHLTAFTPNTYNPSDIIQVPHASSIYSTPM